MKKILLVEDDEFLGKLYFDLLIKSNFAVDILTDGLSAYGKICVADYDLIILDSILPKMSAIDILNKLKNENSSKLKRKFLIFTNIEDSEMLKNLKSFGYEIVIKSHINPDQFLQKVKQYVLG